MSINIIPVDTTGWRFNFHSAVAHYDFDRVTNTRSPHQAVDVNEDGEGTGQPMWKVTCYVVDPQRRQGGEARFLVPAATEPTAEFEEPVTFGGVEVKSWAMNGNSGQSWFAKSFARTSNKPPATVGAGAAASNGKKEG